MTATRSATPNMPVIPGKTHIKAELHAKLGAMYDHLGQYAFAVQELEQAIALYTKIKGADDPQVQELA